MPIGQPRMKPRLRCHNCMRNLENQVDFTYLPYTRWPCSYCGAENIILPDYRVRAPKPKKILNQSDSEMNPDLEEVTAMREENREAGENPDSRQNLKDGVVEGSKSGARLLGGLISKIWSKLDRKMKYRVVLALAGMFVVLVFAMKVQKQVPVPASYNKLLGLSYESVNNSMRTAGFTRVTTRPLKDMKGTDLDKKGTVARVSINGVSSFVQDQQFSHDMDVEILYHEFVDIPVPMSGSELEQYKFEQAFQILAEAGFLVIRLEQDTSTNSGREVGDIKSITIDGRKSFQKDDLYPKDAEIIITYYDPAAS